jgi:hypothetical protein
MHHGHGEAQRLSIRTDVLAGHAKHPHVDVVSGSGHFAVRTGNEVELYVVRAQHSGVITGKSRGLCVSNRGESDS